VGTLDHDLTRQRAGEPLGERIIVHGRVLDGDGRAIPNTLVEIWQANAAGRYADATDQHPAPLDPKLPWRRTVLDGRRGKFPICHDQAGAYRGRNHMNAWRPAHIHFSLLDGRSRSG